MSSNQINTFSLHFDTNQKAGAWALQKHLRHLISNAIIPQLERVFDRIDDKKNLLVIDLIEIDIGSLEPKNIDKVFVDQVVSGITEELKKAGAKQDTEASYKISMDAVITQAFIVFLQTGEIPAKYRLIFKKVSENRLLKAIGKSPEMIEELAGVIRNLPLVKDRLQQQYSTKFVQEIKKITKSPVTEKEKSLPTLEDNVKTKTEEINWESKPKKRSEKSKWNIVDNAGIVLLHPYLSGDNEAAFSLFEIAGLMNEGEFIDATSQVRALHVLQYLVWGKEQHPEHQMVLDKILCGVPLDTPVDRFIRLTEQEKEACFKTVEMVCKSWRGMTETTLVALQESFLQRKGKLSSSSLGWKLIIEKNTLDILLQRLPYGMGVLRFPWMEKLLWVEWDY